METELGQERNTMRRHWNRSGLGMLTAPSVGGLPPGDQESGKPNGNNKLDALDGGRRAAVVAYIANMLQQVRFPLEVFG